MSNLTSNKNIEEIEKELETKTPILTVKNEIIKDKSLNTNLLIEGDNIHSLNILKSRNQKIDIIYIDPPYNTNRNDFIYSDSWANHSSWLEFMKKRLAIALDLLSDDGVIFISIDKREYSYLQILCNDIFGENNYIDTIFWKKSSSKNMSNYLSSEIEPILIYRKSSSLKGFSKKDSDLSNYPLKDEKGYYRLEILRSSSYAYRATQDYPIKVPDGTVIIYPDNELAFMKRQKEGASKHDPCWVICLKTYLQELKDGLIVFKQDKKGYWKVYRKRYAKKNNICFSNVFDGATTQKATRDLKSIFGSKKFDYPKPVSLIKFLLSLYPKKDNVTVLDFFAGSGTTGQATLELNNQDNGSRRFILCTNNENNICENVTYKRLQAVINGYTNQINRKFVEGLPANLTYYKAEFVENIVDEKQVA